MMPRPPKSGPNAASPKPSLAKRGGHGTGVGLGFSIGRKARKDLPDLDWVTGLPIPELNAMVGRILPPFSLILPAWLVVTMVGWRRALEVLPALLVSGASFATMQFYWSNYQQHDPGLVDIVAAIFSLLVMVAFLRLWKPRHCLKWLLKR